MDMELLKSDLERVAGLRTIGGSEAVIVVLERLDATCKSPRTPERLKHYLSNRSYAKALAWLENPDIPHHL